MIEWLGKTIGKVRIDKYLARGGMGEVYLGTHLTLERPVAVKVLHSFIEEDPDLLVRFHREAKVVAGLRHPNIVQIYDFDAIDGHPYIVMEYLNGPPLATYLSDLHKRNERIPHPQVGRLLKELTDALEYAHDQGVIHRDIKPGNIMLHGKAEEFPPDLSLTNDVEAVLMDFGLVRIANAASQTVSGMISGTPAYMSPEQAKGEQTDRRTDIYSLGIVLYEMLAGRVPFEADSTLSLIYKQINDPPPPIPGIPPAVQKVIDLALAKNPDDRYPTAQNMGADFLLAIGKTAEASITREALPQETQRVSGDLPDVSSKGAKATAKSKPDARKPAQLGMGILAVIGVLALVIGAIFIFSRPSILSTATAPSISFTATAPVVSSTATEDAISPTATIVQNNAIVTPTAEIATSETPGLPAADGMVQIPAGAYEVGAASADNYHGALTNLSLNSFWIDQYQVTFEKYQSFLSATGTVAADVLGKGNQPVRGVTWDQAVAYCRWVNKRLPTEAEWEVAGRGPGPNPQLYPWGNKANADGDAANLPDQDTYEVGAFSFNKSPFGVFDLVGNVWEWVGDSYASTSPGSKILRGGRFGVPVLELSYRLTVVPGDTRYIQYAGFRCAADQVK
jgi:serine/threonine protein kinase